MAKYSFQEIVTEAQGVVGEVSGPGTQAYSEDKMFKAAVRGFNLLFKKFYWPQYRQWITITTGTDGKPTTSAFTYVRDVEDILAVCKTGTTVKLPRLPARTNPNALTGTTPTYWSILPVTDADFETKRMRVHPALDQSQFDVLARIYPIDYTKAFAIEDEVDIDKDCLVASTAYMIFMSDDLNPNGADMQKTFLEQRYKDIMGSFSDSEIPVDGTPSQVPMDWVVQP